METSERSARRLLLICGFMVISLLLSGVHADKENTKDPTGNVNLSPFDGWLSAYYCLKNFSEFCTTNYTLTEHGWLSISAHDTQEFCGGGCADHTRCVLKCVNYVKPDYKFMNNATVQDINNTIADGCANGFDGTIHIQKSNAFRSKTVSFLSIALVLGIAFNQLA